MVAIDNRALIQSGSIKVRNENIKIKLPIFNNGFKAAQRDPSSFNHAVIVEDYLSTTDKTEGKVPLHLGIQEALGIL